MKQKYWLKMFKNPITMNKISFIINVTTGFTQLIIGLVFNSFWYINNAIYYLLLCFIRGLTLKKDKQIKQIEDKEIKHQKELMLYKQGGIYICLLAICYFFICFWAYNTGDFVVPSKFYLVYKVAIVSFAKIGLAIYGMIINSNPITTFLKRISFVDAMVSIVVTQCALLTMSNVNEAVEYSAILGMCFCLLFLIIGIFMLKKKIVIKTF